MNPTLQTMWDRQSIRKYRSDPIPENDLNLILEAARRAPTGGNRQKWHMVVVTDLEKRAQTAQACSKQTWMADAAVSRSRRPSRSTVKSFPSRKVTVRSARRTRRTVWGSNRSGAQAASLPSS